MNPDGPGMKKLRLAVRTRPGTTDKEKEKDKDESIDAPTMRTTSRTYDSSRKKSVAEDAGRDDHVHQWLDNQSSIEHESDNPLTAATELNNIKTERDRRDRRRELVGLRKRLVEKRQEHMARVEALRRKVEKSDQIIGEMDEELEAMMDEEEEDDADDDDVVESENEGRTPADC